MRYKKPSEQESAFQEAMSKWVANPDDKKAYDEMWLRVHECCKAAASKICKGIPMPSDVFHDRVMEATMKCMRYILDNGKRPIKLSSFCYLPTLGSMQGPRARREDTELSYEASVENGYEAAINEIGVYLGIVRKPKENTNE